MFEHPLTRRAWLGGAAPYNSRPNRSTRNATDPIYRDGGSKSLLSVKKSSSGLYVATITMGVLSS